MNSTITGTSGFNIYYQFRVTLPLVSLMINLILGVPLNGSVIWLILGASREKMASDFFSLNLALSEFLFALSAIWYMIYVTSLSLQFVRVFYFSFGLLATACPLFQCCICVEYYMGVIHPVLYLRFKPLRYRVGCCCVLWMIIMLSCIYCFFISVKYDFHNFYFYFIQSLLLFSVLLFCCLSVLWALKRPGPGDGDTTKKTTNEMKRRAFNVILVILTFLTLNELVFMTLYPLQCCLKDSVFDIIFGTFSSFALSLGFVRPLFYLYRSGKLPCFSRVK